jgi:protoheme ferro-lyase
LIPWAALLIAGISCGMLTCAALIVRSKRLVPVALLATLTASALLASCGAVWRQTPRLDAIIAAGFIALGATVGGYALGSALLYLTVRPTTTRPALTPMPPASDAVGVIVLSDAEPEQYEPSTVTATLLRHEETGAPLPPELAKPLVYVAERSRYARLGGSPARATVEEIAAALADDLHASHVQATVVPAFSSGGSLGHAVAQLAASGHRRIIVALLSAARTADISSALSDAGSREGADAGIELEVTDALWCSPRLIEMLAARMAAVVAEAGDEVGICLVSPGEPDEIQQRDQRALEQTTFFAERLRAELASTGIASERIRRAYLQWEEPDVSEAARHLAALGAKRLVFVPFAFPTETIQTLLDLRYAAEQAAHDTGAEAVVMSAWGNDPAVARALWELVTAALVRDAD